MALAFSFAGCSAGTDKGAGSADGQSTVQESGDADITSHWEFAKLTREDWSQTRQEWDALNATGVADPVPIPLFECKDGKTCVLNMSGTEHKGDVTRKADGTYEFSFTGGTVWGTATITGRNLHIQLGEDIAQLDFEAQ